MIARMSKYDFILYAGQSDDFIERLRELGLVDVTCRGWEPSEGDRQLVTAIEGRTKALAALERFRSSEHFDAAARPFASGDEAYERYGRTAQERAALRTEIGQTEKAAEEARPWGDFSAGTLQRLARRGVVLRFFTAQRDAFEKSRDAWNEQAPVEVIHETSSTVWFVAVSHEGAELSFDAQEVKAPAMTAHDAEAKVASLRSRLSATDAEMSRAAASAALIERDCNRLREELQRVKVTATAEVAADGTLLVMEGWAERETSDRVDALLDEYPNVLNSRGARCAAPHGSPRCAPSRRSYSASSADRSSASRSKRTSRRSPSSTSRGGFSRGRWPSAWCRFCSDKYCVSSW